MFHGICCKRLDDFRPEYNASDSHETRTRATKFVIRLLNNGYLAGLCIRLRYYRGSCDPAGGRKLGILGILATTGKLDTTTAGCPVAGDSAPISIAQPGP